MEPMSPALAGRLNHWTTREAQTGFIFINLEPRRLDQEEGPWRNADKVRSFSIRSNGTGDHTRDHIGSR